MTLQQAAEQTIAIQDACNGTAVSNLLHEIMLNTLWPEAVKLGKGTDWVNQHPIVSLLLDKLASLNRSQCLCDKNISKFGDAYDYVRRLAGKDTDV